MEGMTTRLPIPRIEELAWEVLGMSPWSLLIVSGADDIGAVARKRWVAWVGTGLTAGLLAWLEHYTQSAVTTRVAMPFLAAAVGILPHAFPRLRLVYSLASILAGALGIVVLCYETALILQGGGFASFVFGALILGFAGTSIMAGALSILQLVRQPAGSPHV